jgi:hypothetical protein
MKYFLFILLIFAISLSNFGPVYGQKDKTVALFNGKNLAGWDSYLGPPLDDAGKKTSEVPIGLNVDPNDVFTIVNIDGQNAIRISGQNWGAISTKHAYADFHLQLMFRWGVLTWGQKKGRKKDSGLLYFSVGENGADYGAWMRSQEFQIEEGNCGDYWGVAGAMEDVPVLKKSDSEYVYNSNKAMQTFSAVSKPGRHCIKQGDAENPTGEWNTLDLYCHGDTSVHIINGKVMMVLYHSSQSENGQAIPLAKGKIQLQSEGAEIFYKNITVGQVDKIPTEFLK